MILFSSSASGRRKKTQLINLLQIYRSSIPLCPDNNLSLGHFCTTWSKLHDQMHRSAVPATLKTNTEIFAKEKNSQLYRKLNPCM